MINRFFYRSSITQFISQSTDEIFGLLSKNDEGDTVAEQKFAWTEEVEIVKRARHNHISSNPIIFKY